jgi:hypothetical protein
MPSLSSARWPAQRRALPNPADLARIRCSVLARSPRACTGLPATVFCDLQTFAALDPNSRWGGWAPRFRRTGSPEPPPRSSSVRGSYVKVSTGCCTGFSAWALLLIPAGSASARGPRRPTIRCTLASDNAGANVAFLGRQIRSSLKVNAITKGAMLSSIPEEVPMTRIVLVCSTGRNRELPSHGPTSWVVTSHHCR